MESSAIKVSSWSVNVYEEINDYTLKVFFFCINDKKPSVTQSVRMFHNEVDLRGV